MSRAVRREVKGDVVKRLLLHPVTGHPYSSLQNDTTGSENTAIICVWVPTRMMAHNATFVQQIKENEFGYYYRLFLDVWSYLVAVMPGGKSTSEEGLYRKVVAIEMVTDEFEPDSPPGDIAARVSGARGYRYWFFYNAMADDITNAVDVDADIDGDDPAERNFAGRRAAAASGGDGAAPETQEQRDIRKRKRIGKWIGKNSMAGVLQKLIDTILFHRQKGNEYQLSPEWHRLQGLTIEKWMRACSVVTGIDHTRNEATLIQARLTSGHYTGGVANPLDPQVVFSVHNAMRAAEAEGASPELCDISEYSDDLNLVFPQPSCTWRLALQNFTERGSVLGFMLPFVSGKQRAPVEQRMIDRYIAHADSDTERGDRKAIVENLLPFDNTDSEALPNVAILRDANNDTRSKLMKRVREETDSIARARRSGISADELAVKNAQAEATLSKLRFEYEHEFMYSFMPLWNEFGRVPESIKKMIKWSDNYLETLRANGAIANLCMPRPRQTTDYSNFGELMTRLAIDLEVAFKITYTHREGLIEWLCCMSVLLGVGESVHFAHLGMQAAGKSYTQSQVQKMLIEGTYKILTYFTEKAFTGADEEKHAMLCFFINEMQAHVVGADSNKSKQGTGETSSHSSVAMFKDMLDSSKVNVAAFSRDEVTGERRLEMIEKILPMVFIVAANFSKWKIDEAVGTRFTFMQAILRMLESRTVLKSDSADRGAYKSQIASVIAHRRRDQYLIALVCHMIQARGMENIDTTVASTFISHVVGDAKGKGMRDVDPVRNKQRLVRFAKILTIQNGINIVFDSPTSPFINKRWDITHVYALFPYLFTTSEICAFSCTLLKEQYTSTIKFHVIKKLIDLMFPGLDTAAAAPNSVFFDSDNPPDDPENPLYVSNNMNDPNTSDVVMSMLMGAGRGGGGNNNNHQQQRVQGAQQSGWDANNGGYGNSNNSSSRRANQVFNDKQDPQRLLWKLAEQIQQSMDKHRPTLDDVYGELKSLAQQKIVHNRKPRDVLSITKKPMTSEVWIHVSWTMLKHNTRDLFSECTVDALAYATAPLEKTYVLGTNDRLKTADGHDIKEEDREGTPYLLDAVTVKRNERTWVINRNDYMNSSVASMFVSQNTHAGDGGAMNRHVLQRVNSVHAASVLEGTLDEWAESRHFSRFGNVTAHWCKYWGFSEEETRRATRSMDEVDADDRAYTMNMWKVSARNMYKAARMHDFVDQQHEAFRREQSRRRLDRMVDNSNDDDDFDPPASDSGEEFDPDLYSFEDASDESDSEIDAKLAVMNDDELCDACSMPGEKRDAVLLGRIVNSVSALSPHAVALERQQSLSSAHEAAAASSGTYPSFLDDEKKSSDNSSSSSSSSNSRSRSATAIINENSLYNAMPGPVLNRTLSGTPTSSPTPPSPSVAPTDHRDKRHRSSHRRPQSSRSSRSSTPDVFAGIRAQRAEDMAAEAARERREAAINSVDAFRARAGIPPTGVRQNDADEMEWEETLRNAHEVARQQKDAHDMEWDENRMMAEMEMD